MKDILDTVSDNLPALYYPVQGLLTLAFSNTLQVTQLVGMPP